MFAPNASVPPASVLFSFVRVRESRYLMKEEEGKESVGFGEPNAHAHACM